MQYRVFPYFGSRTHEAAMVRYIAQLRQSKEVTKAETKNPNICSSI
jgi:hypothetical protein